MLLTPQWIWLIAGLILCGAEMLVGTFYLLVLGVSCLAAAGCAWLGLVVGWQCLAFAAVAVTGGLFVRHLKGQHNDAHDPSDYRPADEDRTVLKSCARLSGK